MNEIPPESLIRLNLSGMVGSALLRELRAHADLKKLDRLSEAMERLRPALK